MRKKKKNLKWRNLVQMLKLGGKTVEKGKFNLKRRWIKQS
jgi:hypothetical protein